MCHTQTETVEHIISGCQTLAADQYLNRHNQVAAQLHWTYAGTMASKWKQSADINIGLNE